MGWIGVCGRFASTRRSGSSSVPKQRKSWVGAVSPAGSEATTGGGCCFGNPSPFHSMFRSRSMCQTRPSIASKSCDQGQRPTRGGCLRPQSRLSSSRSCQSSIWHLPYDIQSVLPHTVQQSSIAPSRQNIGFACVKTQQHKITAGVESSESVSRPIAYHRYPKSGEGCFHRG